MRRSTVTRRNNLHNFCRGFPLMSGTYISRISLAISGEKSDICTCRRAQKTSENGGYEDDNQRCNEKIKTAEPHHAGGFRMSLEQGAELWRQGAACQTLLQRAEQALLLRSGLRVP